MARKLALLILCAAFGLSLTAQEKITVRPDVSFDGDVGQPRPRSLYVDSAGNVLALAGEQEKITLSVAESNPEYSFRSLMIVPDDPATSSDEGNITVTLKGANGETVSCPYSAGTNPTGTFLITALNKANLSTAYAGNATTGSLKQRVCHRLVIMGESTAICGKTITGSCTGSVP